MKITGYPLTGNYDHDVKTLLAEIRQLKSELSSWVNAAAGLVKQRDELTEQIQELEMEIVRLRSLR